MFRNIVKNPYNHLILCTLLLMILPYSASAVGVAVKPKKINIVAERGKTVTEKIVVSNIFNEALIYEIALDDYKNIITVNPKSIKLFPKESHIITLNIAARGYTKKTTFLSVVAHPLSGNDLKISSGVKIPFELNVKVNMFDRVMLAVFFVCLMLVIAIAQKKTTTQ